MRYECVKEGNIKDLSLSLPMVAASPFWNLISGFGIWYEPQKSKLCILICGHLCKKHFGMLASQVFLVGR